MTEITVLQLMDYLEQQNGDDASWMWLELRRLLEAQEKANQPPPNPASSGRRTSCVSFAGCR